MRLRNLIAGIAAITLGFGLAPAASAAPATQSTSSTPATMGISTPLAAVGQNVNVYSQSNPEGPFCGEDGMSSEVNVYIDGVLALTEKNPDSLIWYPTFKVPDTPGTYSISATCTTDAGTVKFAPVKIRVLPPAPDNITAQVGEITRDGCQVLIPVTTTGDYTFELEVWDDQRKLESIIWDTTGTSTTVHTWTITGRPDTSFPGDIYFQVRVNGSSFINSAQQTAQGEYSYSDYVADSCSAKVPVTASLTSKGPAITPGETVTIAGTGLLAGEGVDVTVQETGVRIGGKHAWVNESTTSTDGKFSFDVTVPEGIPAGNHVLIVKGQASYRSARIPITVQSAGLQP